MGRFDKHIVLKLNTNLAALGSLSPPIAKPIESSNSCQLAILVS